LLLKISPDLTANQLDEIIEIYHETGIDGIVATNTTRSRDFLHTSSSVIESIGDGGLSGYPLKEKSTGIIRYLSRQTNGKMPIMAVGGIMTPDDAIEKINSGATLVQIYTGFIYEGPGLIKRINKAILKKRKDPVSNAFINQPAI
ncbi:MAG: dihydroorotate dehydrogenase (quinone), partial [bacterium]